MLRSFIITIFAAASWAGAASAEEPTAAPTAALIYADWCGSCKVLDPKFETAKAEAGDRNAQFVTLDYTGRNVDDFLAAADAAGVGDAVRAHTKDGKKVKTGQLLIINAAGETTAKLGRNTTPSDILAAVDAAT